MKRICTLLLAAGMLLGVATGASAIDFKAKGQWLMGFGLAETNPIHKSRNDNVKTTNTKDQFGAQQRVRLQLDAVASEALSGTVFFEIGNQVWGSNKAGVGGGALGADGANAIKVKRAYIDWMVPQTDLKFRMGIQGVTLPNKAGGSAIMDTDAAGVTASYQFNENVGLTAMWVRALNDNYAGEDSHGVDNYRQNFLDNADLFALMVPVKLDGFEITPWAMYGAAGKNSLNGYNVQGGWGTADGDLSYTMRPYPATMGAMGNTSKAYGNMFWAGLPFAITAWDPLNIEVDVNYGYVEAMGRYDAWKGPRVADNFKRGSTERQGWLAKALVEYKMDWGVPGIFGWYGSGDDGNVKNGSERMPSIVPMGNFTSFLGDGNYGWMYTDYAVDYSGTWGLGLQIRDMSFVEDLKHTFRVAYWGGTNSPSMAKYMGQARDWANGYDQDNNGPYLTTNDGLLEFNLVNSYQMYENFDVNLELGYIANFVDNDTWNKAGNHNSSFQKQDMWKAQLIFAYSF